jgi:hypothetical protein
MQAMFSNAPTHEAEIGIGRGGAIRGDDVKRATTFQLFVDSIEKV